MSKCIMLHILRQMGFWSDSQSLCHERSSGVPWKMIQSHLTGLKTIIYTLCVSFVNSCEHISIMFNHTGTCFTPRKQVARKLKLKWDYMLLHILFVPFLFWWLGYWVCKLQSTSVWKVHPHKRCDCKWASLLTPVRRKQESALSRRNKSEMFIAWQMFEIETRFRGFCKYPALIGGLLQRFTNVRASLTGELHHAQGARQTLTWRAERTGRRREGGGGKGGAMGGTDPPTTTFGKAAAQTARNSCRAVRLHPNYIDGRKETE